MQIIKFIKNWALPLAMTTGALFYKTIDQLSFMVPILLFAMIFITYCRLSLKEIKFHRIHFWLLVIQLAMGITLFFALKTVSTELAQGVMICILAPTATAAAVVTAMMGGNIALLASYTLFSNLAIAIVTPILFPLFGIKADLPFLQSLLFIFKQVFPLLIVPFIGTLLLSKLTPRFYGAIRGRQSISFYLWALSLTIVTARTVRFLAEHGSDNIKLLSIMAMSSLAVCIIQFAIGRWLGRKMGDVVSGGQALGQKNTILTIWMAQAYMLPLASLGPASYILWQNSINTLQLWRHRRQHSKQMERT